jgi:hypothetical protein
VTVNNPPLNGPHSGDSSAVEVIVSRVQPTMLGPRRRHRRKRSLLHHGPESDGD